MSTPSDMSIAPSAAAAASGVDLKTPPLKLAPPKSGAGCYATYFTKENFVRVALVALGLFGAVSLGLGVAAVIAPGKYTIVSNGISIVKALDVSTSAARAIFAFVTMIAGLGSLGVAYQFYTPLKVDPTAKI
ncbi:MAG: hypothetical protein H0X51_09370 [Parachlamydiaceae bacterium]|nr:hypothetical protein [Parachlamydiaceae bacterium]